MTSKLTKTSKSLPSTDMWSFSWPHMDVLIGGNSSIDLPFLAISSKTEAEKFITTYGFDVSLPQDRRLLEAMKIEALAFIERFLMPKEWQKGNVPPLEILGCCDATDLLMFASDQAPAHAKRRAWACAVLRVMHTIAHLEGIQRRADIDVAKDQIMARFQKHIIRDVDGSLWFGQADDRVMLDRVDWKHEKTRDSILLKLLHKPGNVAETIYDLIGVRIIPRRLCDVMLVIKFLEDFHMISFPNCVPSRARNRLVNLDTFRKKVAGLRLKVLEGKMSDKEFSHAIEKMAWKAPKSTKANPHSGSQYRSVQLTARQLIRNKNPDVGWLEKLEELVKDGSRIDQSTLQRVVHFINGWQGVQEMKQTAAFFPFEIQVMDSASFKKSGRGNARHDRYKDSQIQAARERVLRGVLRKAG